MATVTITLAAGTEAGALGRKFGRAFAKALADVPDRVSTGASTVITIDNATTVGQVASVQVTSGPYAGAKYYV